MGQARHEYAFRGEIDRAQLGMGFHKEAVRIQLHLEAVAQFLGGRGWHDRVAQHQYVRVQRDRLAEDRFPHLDLDRAVAGIDADLRLAGIVVLNEDHAAVPRLGIEAFLETVAADVLVQHGDLRRGLELLEQQGVLESGGAADAAAILFRGPHAQDHDQ